MKKEELLNMFLEFVDKKTYWKQDNDVTNSQVINAFLEKYETRAPKKDNWFCRVLGWHKRPKEIGFDGLSYVGQCPKCSRKVLQDSQGNWFSV
jgi:hypothetical protein